MSDKQMSKTTRIALKIVAVLAVSTYVGGIWYGVHKSDLDGKSMDANIGKSVIVNGEKLMIVNRNDRVSYVLVNKVVIDRKLAEELIVD